MPINIKEDLPARAILEKENIFIMSEDRASHQDIRPLRIAILNLMPKKLETETQLLRLLGNTPLQVDVELLQTASHQATHVSAEHLLKFYKSFADIEEKRFDGLIITGAPVEQLAFEQVDYWEELCRIMEWSKHNVYSTLHICWGAQAGLYYHYQIEKEPLPQKIFGIYSHDVLAPNHMLMRGFDESYYAPHSRHTASLEEQLLSCEKLSVLSRSKEAGCNIIAAENGRQFFITSHSEYDRTTLAEEYLRDKEKGLPIAIPKNYFPEDNPKNLPRFLWRGHAHLLFSNWLNYYVYQQTPFELKQDFQ